MFKEKEQRKEKPKQDNEKNSCKATQSCKGMKKDPDHSVGMDKKSKHDEKMEKRKNLNRGK